MPSSSPRTRYPRSSLVDSAQRPRFRPRWTPRAARARPARFNSQSYELKAPRRRSPAGMEVLWRGGGGATGGASGRRAGTRGAFGDLPQVPEREDSQPAASPAPTPGPRESSKDRGAARAGCPPWVRARAGAPRLPRLGPLGPLSCDFDRAHRYLEALNSGAGEEIRRFLMLRRFKTSFRTDFCQASVRNLEAMKGEPRLAAGGGRRRSKLGGASGGGSRSQWKWSVTPSVS